MIRPLVFVLLSGLLVAVVSVIQGTVPKVDPFADARAGAVSPMMYLRADQFVTMKLRHAANREPYDVGLFGNSRAIEVGARHLEASPRRFFNFAVGGESVRGSLTLLEHLAAMGKAPRVALVSVDNFELQMYNNPFFLDLAPRWREAARDLWAGVARPGISPLEAARMAWRVLLNEARTFHFLFDPASLARTVRDILLPEGVAVGPDGPAGYRVDGSLQAPERAEDRPSDLRLEPQRGGILLGYLDRDLERFAALQAGGTRVVLYESPLEPDVADRLAAQPSAPAAASRERFLATCARLALTCLSAPRRLPESDGVWFDASHPPPESLGPYLRGLLQRLDNGAGGD